MRLFGLKSKTTRIGLLVEIGSGSVLTAFVNSNPENNHPDIIWSKREHIPLRQSYNFEDLSKSVLTALFNSLLNVDGEGRKRLKEVTDSYNIDTLFVTYSPPFAHTIVKTINYKRDEVFELSKDLLAELLRQAETALDDEIKLRSANLHNELVGVSRVTLDLEANGYLIREIDKQNVREVVVSEGSSIVNKKFTEAISDFRQKFQPKSRLEQYSFMLPYYYIARDLDQIENDCCLVNVTFEATELAIVRDGRLRYVTHKGAGLYTLAREISEIVGVPSEEVYGYFAREDFKELMTGYSEEKQTAIDAAFLSYKEKLKDLFTETGDLLTLPKYIYLHGNLYTEKFIAELINQTVSQNTDLKHAVINVSKLIFDNYYTEEEQLAFKKEGLDTGLLISAQFFHNSTYQASFEQL